MEIFQNIYHGFSKALPNKICNEIIDFGLSFKKERGTTFGEKTVNKKLFKSRNSFVTWLNVFWIYKEIIPYINRSNQEGGWHLDYNECEHFQFTEYDGNEKQHYGWHTDVSFKTLKNNRYRKLSTIVMLTDPKEYEGGDLEFYGYQVPRSKNCCYKPKDQNLHERGSIINFPSLYYHRVKPVTKGRRYSLVMWHRGPRIK